MGLGVRVGEVERGWGCVLRLGLGLGVGISFFLGPGGTCEVDRDALVRGVSPWAEHAPFF